MRIAIASRLNPFTHLPGTSLRMPGSGIPLRIFPARIVLGSLGTLDLQIAGPVAGFTISQDLERGVIKVWGHSSTGYFRYRLIAATENGGVLLETEKVPLGGLVLDWRPGTQQDVNHVILQSKESLLMGSASSNDGMTLFTPLDTERLSLGCHKAQLWEHVRERLDMAEIMPVWFRLGRLVRASRQPQGSGTTQLLQQCREAAIDGPRDVIVPAFQQLFRAGFSGMLAPRLNDDDHQGFALPPATSEEDPLTLLTVGSEIIRQLFVSHQHQEISLLPMLPSEFHCGRFLNAACSPAGTLDFEWSKHTIRRVVFRCDQAGEWTFLFQHHVKSCRLRYHDKDPGRTLRCGDPITTLAGHSYLFDNFER